MSGFHNRARALRARETSAEARLWQALRGRRLAGWKFRRQHPIDRYVVDFVTLPGKLVIEVDGVTHGGGAEITRDAARADALERLGFMVIRVTNVDVYENLDGVLEAIVAQLSGR
ncbi:endonuclease domain-containing protein [Hansschlegelia sp.]|uniref:endonuclease domain-containing protein n=1 Tax=Hansschlegelia sp. TaxID=2041892 RepID=UPI002B8C9D11|nr:endonuclease domain-containing protein [Hansschlegelia sp.]HVI27845.1 endonuclease domain-containing protein [Hansschlegelia sp.]